MTGSSCNKRLEVLCDRIEATLAAHRMPLRIHSGVLGRDYVLLRFNTALPSLRVSEYGRFRDVFAAAANVSEDTVLVWHEHGVGILRYDMTIREAAS